MESKSKHTTSKQFQILLDFMTSHPDLSKVLLKTADARSTSTNLWKKLSNDLNAAGPPMRDLAGWKKVWADYKVHLKAKMRRNKHSISGTGGGASYYCSVTELEQQVCDLLSMAQSVIRIMGTLEFGVEQTTPNAPTETPLIIDSDQDQETPRCSYPRTPRSNQTLLEKQVENQVSYHKTSTKVLEEISASLLNVNKNLIKSNKIKIRKLNLAKEKFIHKQKVDRDKIRLKLNLLEIKREVLNVQLGINNN